MEAEKSEYGLVVEFLASTARSGHTEGLRNAQLFLDYKKADKRITDVKSLHQAQGIFLAQMPKLVGKVNFAQSAAMGRVGRATLGSLYGLLFARRGGSGSESRMGIGMLDVDFAAHSAAASKAGSVGGGRRSNLRRRLCGCGRGGSCRVVQE